MSSKSFKDYLAEAEESFDRPRVGDDFAISCREECLLETWVCDETPDGVVLHADERMMQLLEGYGYIGKHDIVEAFQNHEEYMKWLESQPKPSSSIGGWIYVSPKVDGSEHYAKFKNLETNQDEVKTFSNLDALAQWLASTGTGFDYSGYSPNPPLQKKLLALYKKYDAKGVSEAEDDSYESMTDRELIKLAQQTGRGKSVNTDGHGTLINRDKIIDILKQDEKMDEAKYQGREVPLGKPMAGDVKKSKVYVRGPKGNVVKVNFGQKGMKIKKSIPGRRKNFRARHNCDNPGPRWKARYWSCRAW